MDSEGRVVFFSPSGRPVAAAARRSRLGADPVGDLVAANRRRGADPQWDTIMPSRHHHSPMPWEVEADAWEALDRAAERRDARDPATDPRRGLERRAAPAPPSEAA
jgi:hypothetical protein